MRVQLNLWPMDHKKSIAKWNKWFIFIQTKSFNIFNYSYSILSSYIFLTLSYFIKLTTTTATINHLPLSKKKKKNENHLLCNYPTIAPNHPLISQIFDFYFIVWLGMKRGIGVWRRFRLKKRNWCLKKNTFFFFFLI